MAIIELFGDKYEVAIKRTQKKQAMVVLHDIDTGEPSVISVEMKSLNSNEVAVPDLANEMLTDKLIETGLFTCADRLVLPAARVLLINN